MSAELRQLRGRLAAQEKLSNFLHGRIEELTEDMSLSFKSQVEVQLAFEQKVDARFDAIQKHLDEKLEAMEARILDAFKQLMAVTAEKKEAWKPTEEDLK